MSTRRSFLQGAAAATAAVAATHSDVKGEAPSWREPKEDIVRLVRFDDWLTGLVIEREESLRVLNVGASLEMFRRHSADGAGLLAGVLPGGGRGSWRSMIERWSEACAALRELITFASDEGRSASLAPLESVVLQPPLPAKDGRIIALGGNVAAHMVGVFREVFGRHVPPSFFTDEKKQGLPPWGFLVLPETAVGPDAVVSPPDGVQKFDYEVEVAAILKNGGRQMRAEDVELWGYTAHNDFGIRDSRLGIGLPIHRGAFSWALEKNFDTAKAFGPWTLADAAGAAGPFRCQLRVNGETRQDWSTSEMIWSFAETAAYISKYFTLSPGDVICSGTGAGTAVESGRDGERWLRAGDSVEAEVEGIGVLRNGIGAWPQT